MRCSFGNNRAHYGYSIPPPLGSSQKHRDYVVNLFLPGTGMQERYKPAEPSEIAKRIVDADPM